MIKTAQILTMRTALYRHYDASGHLLYVGISLSPMTRTAQHCESSVWFDSVARIEIEWHENRKEALRAERLEIKSASPKFNIAHNCETLRGFVPILRTVSLLKWLEMQGRGAAADLARKTGLSESQVTRLADGAIPLVTTAIKIEDATGGAVPARAWVE